jgi:hypothetical protein
MTPIRPKIKIRKMSPVRRVPPERPTRTSESPKKSEGKISKLVWIIISSLVGLAIAYALSWWEPKPQLSARVIERYLDTSSSSIVSEIVVTNPDRLLIPSSRLTAKDIIIYAQFDAVPHSCIPGVSCHADVKTEVDNDCTVTKQTRWDIGAGIFYKCPTINASQSRSFILSHPDKDLYKITVTVEIEGYVNTRVFSRCSKDPANRESLYREGPCPPEKPE